MYMYDTYVYMNMIFSVFLNIKIDELRNIINIISKG
jgi:hypothetical protein